MKLEHYRCAEITKTILSSDNFSLQEIKALKDNKVFTVIMAIEHTAGNSSFAGRTFFWFDETQEYFELIDSRENQLAFIREALMASSPTSAIDFSKFETTPYENINI